MAFHAIPAPRPVRALRLTALLLLSVASVPGLAQAQQATAGQAGGAPKSLLPDDLDTGVPPPAGGVEQAPSAIGEAPGAVPGGFAPEAGPAVPLELPKPPEPEPSDPLAELAGPTADPAFAGLLTPATGGYAADLFAGSDARFLATLLGRIEAPLASRWAQILLQRALLTRAAAPAGLNPADWVAARAHALQAMGAGADAHRLVSRIAVDRYTPRLYAAALQSALATADPMALCPLSPTARPMTGSPSWTLVDAMCLSILGDDVGASALFDGLRRRNEVNPFDIGLAERVSSAISGGRRGANPEWGEVKGLTAWRLGLSSAAGLDVPAELLETASAQQRAWIVRLPGEDLAVRARLAPGAAATGAISSAEINRVLAAEAASLDPGAVARSPGGQLRQAQVAADIADRLDALKALWSRADAGTADQYGWQVATGPAVARLPASSGLGASAPDIAASLMAAGITGPASAWWRAADGADDGARAATWAQLVAASNAVPVESGLFGSWARTVPAHRAQLLAAGLAGLGRGDVGADVPVIENDWTRALDAAVAARRAGEVMVLAASGLRGSWAEVPPDYLRRIAAALVAVGRAGEARLIVAEAANRG